MKSDRLFNIIYILIDKKYITAKELAERLEVSTRTIYRDIETLSMANIPIYTDRGSGGGIGISDNYVLNKSIISKKQRKDIAIALDLLRATKYSDTSETIDKIGSIFADEHDNCIEIDLSDFGKNNQKHIFSTIKESLASSTAIEIDYKSYNQNLKKRTIYPLKLTFKKQRWYLIAFCKSKQEVRTFRISRIKGVEISSEVYLKKDYPVDDYVVDYIKLDDELIHVELVLKNSCHDRVYEEFGINYKKDLKGNLIVNFKISKKICIDSYILSYLSHIIDIKPTYIKENLIKKIKSSNLI